MAVRSPTSTTGVPWSVPPEVAATKRDDHALQVAERLTFMQKPFSPKALAQKVREVLDRKLTR